MWGRWPPHAVSTEIRPRRSETRPILVGVMMGARDASYAPLPLLSRRVFGQIGDFRLMCVCVCVCVKAPTLARA